MVSNDIYNNKGKYEKFKHEIDKLVIPPEQRYTGKTYKGIYYCKNKANLKYFRKLCTRFESQDISFIRRLRYLRTLQMITYFCNKDMIECKRDDIDKIMAEMHQRYKSPTSKVDFVKNIKRIWRILFPEKDEKGRIDESICPYPVRHLTRKVDKSKEKRRNDKLTFEEFEKLLDYFANDSRMQFYLMFSIECLARPQELLYLRIKDVDLYDNYAKIWISSHGKEGTGLLQCIDSHPYLVKWLQEHPFKGNKDSFLFVKQSKSMYGDQLTPQSITFHLRIACKHLNIDKQVTAYSLKRIGVSFKRLRGYSDAEIQHTARWSSTAQIKTYDQTDQEDAFKIALVKRGLIEDENLKEYEPTTKTCMFCNTINGFTEDICTKCQRPLDRKKIQKEFEENTRGMELMQEKIQQLESKMQEQNQIADIIKKLAKISPETMQTFVDVMEKVDKRIEEAKVN